MDCSNPAALAMEPLLMTTYRLHEPYSLELDHPSAFGRIDYRIINETDGSIVLESYGRPSWRHSQCPDNFVRDVLEYLAQEPDSMGALYSNWLKTQADSLLAIAARYESGYGPGSLALSLLDWHGGQSSALYSVGSCMLAGDPAALHRVRGAMNELRRIHKATANKADRRQLRCLARRLADW